MVNPVYLGEILCRNHDLFEQTTNENITVVVSLHKTCEIQKYIGGNSNWDIHHFSMSRFDELGVQRILQYLME